jgi:hypothetical protein
MRQVKEGGFPDMRKLLKASLAAVLACAMLFALCMPSHAILASECGTFVTKNPSYNKDGQYYMSFKIQAGCPPNTSGYTTLVRARLINSAGQTVATWPQREISSGTTQTREYYTSYSNRPHGTYTFALDVTSRGREYGTGKTISYSFTWKYTVNHTGPPLKTHRRKGPEAPRQGNFLQRTAQEAKKRSIARGREAKLCFSPRRDAAMPGMVLG